MGPLFSIALLAAVLAAVLLAALIVLWRFQRPAVALWGACAFAIGALGAAGVGVVFGALLFGPGTHLSTSFQVITYLAFVASGALAGGACLAWLVIRKKRH